MTANSFSLPDTFSFNAPTRRVLAAILFCFQPVFEPGDISAFPTVAPHTLKFYSQKWKDLGAAACLEPHPGRTEIKFSPPDPVSRQEAAANENFIRQECLKEHHRLLSAFPLTDDNVDQYADALHKSRLKRQKELQAWLLDRLQILGLRAQNQYSPWPAGESAAEWKFDFPIKGTPAQFGVMLQPFIATLQTQAEHARLTCQVIASGKKANPDMILPEANPVKIKLAGPQGDLAIHAHLLPAGGTLLRIHLQEKPALWLLWDNIRDELEKLGWFELPQNLWPAAPIQPEAQQETNPETELSGPWLLVSKTNNNQDIVRLLYMGLTHKEIGTRMGLATQTITNRLRDLRKIHGEKIIPRRR